MNAHSSAMGTQPNVIILVQVFTALSALACMWMLWHLWRLRKQVSHRLFWRQLIALALTDLVWSLIGIPPYFEWFDPTVFKCELFLYSRQTLEFTSCCIEVQIAMGFAAACFRVGWAPSALRWVCNFSWMVGLVLFICTYPSLHVKVRKQDHQCDIGSQLGWDIVVLSCCLATLLFYGASVCGAVKSAPQVVRARVLWRGFCYIAVFLVSFGLKALQDLFLRGYNTWSVVAWCALCLSGAVNVVNYACQNPQARARTQLNFSVGFVDGPEVVTKFDHYFDFDTEIATGVITDFTCAGGPCGTGAGPPQRVRSPQSEGIIVLEGTDSA